MFTVDTTGTITDATATIAAPRYGMLRNLAASEWKFAAALASATLVLLVANAVFVMGHNAGLAAAGQTAGIQAQVSLITPHMVKDCTNAEKAELSEVQVVRSTPDTQEWVCVYANGEKRSFTQYATLIP